MPMGQNGKRLLLFGDNSYSKKLQRLFGSSIVGYWPMWESSGSVSADISGRGHNGAYTGVDLNQPGIGDRRTCPLFDGVNDYNNIYSAGLNTDMNKDEGTIASWCKVAGAGVWTDATARHFATFEIDGANVIRLRRGATNNAIECGRVVGGVNKNVTDTGLAGTLAWFHVAMTWSVSANELKAYINGSQVGSTQTTIPTLVGGLAPTLTCLGSRNQTPLNPWSGYLAHAILLNRPATAAEVLAMSRVP